MKSIKIILIFLVSSYLLHAQTANFSNYDNVSDDNFKKFLTLFSEKSLPISTDQIISTIDIWHLKKAALSQNLIDKYLMYNGELITGPLYMNKPDDNIPEKEIVGTFYPLYKLPTNGDYVLLVFAQVEDPRERECTGMVFTLSYDLTGHFKYFANYTYRAGADNINSIIDINLISDCTYVLYEVEGEFATPPFKGIFNGMEARQVEQINTDGRCTEISFEKTPGRFEYSLEECRFKRVN